MLSTSPSSVNCHSLIHPTCAQAVIEPRPASRLPSTWPSPYHNKCTEPLSNCSYPNPPQPVHGTFAYQDLRCEGTYTVDASMACKADGYYKGMYKEQEETTIVGCSKVDEEQVVKSRQTQPRPGMGERRFASVNIPRGDFKPHGICGCAKEDFEGGQQLRLRQTQEYLEDQIEQQLYSEKKVRQRWYA